MQTMRDVSSDSQMRWFAFSHTFVTFTTYLSDCVAPCGIQHPSLDWGPSSTAHTILKKLEFYFLIGICFPPRSIPLILLGKHGCILQVSMETVRTSHGKHHLWLNISKIASNQNTFQTSNISLICWKLMMLLFHGPISWRIRYISRLDNIRKVAKRRVSLM